VRQVNRATAEQAQETALEEGLAPLMGWAKRLCDTLIQDRFGHPDLEFAWGDKRPVDPGDQSKILDTYVQRGVMSINEARDVLGLDPIEGGDIATITVPGQGPVPVAQLGQSLEPGSVREVAKSGARPFPRPATSPARRRAAAELHREITRFFDEEAPRVAAEIYRARKVRLAKADDDDDDDDVTPVDQDQHRLEAAILAALLAINFGRWAVLVAPIAAVLADLGSSTFDDTVAAVGAANMVGSGLDWARAFARSRAAELVGRRWIGDQTVDDPDADEAITASTADMLKPKIRQAITEKMTQAEFAAELAQSVFSRARAERIAEYETTKVFHQATLQAFKQSGRVTQVNWVTMGDDLVEEVCEDNENGGPIDLGGTFPSGDDAPPAHVACRCWLEPVAS
jgi:hypothetical protein